MRAGTVVGRLEIYAADELVNQVNLVIKEDVEAGWFPSYVGISNFATIVICLILAMIAACFLAIAVMKARYRRKRQRIRQRKIIEQAMAEMRREKIGVFKMFDIKENLKKLPDTPGVYMHKDKLGQIIYVGKAISLRNRVRQYFQSAAKSNPKVAAMVAQIAEFEYITCSTEMEALILECNLIKKYMPRYNVLLRDDKTYPYIKVTTSEDFPRVLKTRLIKKDGNKYFGPYSDAGAVNQIVELLSNIYSLKRCSAREFPANHRPCLNFHLCR